MEKYLICPGVQKAATTSLFSYLINHPSICTATKKETGYFLMEPDQISREEYLETFFAHRMPGQVLCDVDPEYLYYSDSAAKIYSNLGDKVFFVIMLRNPVDRAHSHYWMSFRRGFVSVPFEVAIERESEIIAIGDLASVKHQSFIARGYYCCQIKKYLQYYPRDHLHIVLFEDFVDSREQVMRNLCTFIDVDPELLKKPERTAFNKGGLPRSMFLSRLRGKRMLIKDVLKSLIPAKLRFQMMDMIEEYNRGSVSPPEMSAEIRVRLNKLFLNDIDELEELIGMDLSRWRT